MVGVIGLGLVWLGAGGRASRRGPGAADVDLGATRHGSYPLALVLVVCVLVGALARPAAGTAWRSLSRRVQRRLAVAVVARHAARRRRAAGFRVLTFPWCAVQRADVFGQVTEWQAPQFRSPGRARLPACCVLVAIVAPEPTRPVAAHAAGRSPSSLRRCRPAEHRDRDVVLVAVVAAAAPRRRHAAVDRPTVARRRSCRPARRCACSARGGRRVLTRGPGLGGYPAHALSLARRRTAASARRLADAGLHGQPAGGARRSERRGVRRRPGRHVPDRRSSTTTCTLHRGEPGWERVLDSVRDRRRRVGASEPLASLLAADPAGVSSLQRHGVDRGMPADSAMPALSR